MYPINSQKEIRETVQALKTRQSKVGFVPTMGALHQGHLSLIDYALRLCNHVVVSIFVNPTQFNNSEDLKKYPRTLEADIALLKKYKDQVVVYAPSPEEVYSGKVSSTSYGFGPLETVMEGEHRPGHFDGVGTVLNLLFRQVQPDMAFFGEKDFQQLQIVRKLVSLEHLDVEIVGCPIHRQADGLAMSSRNARLTSDQLKQAPFIYKTLSYVRDHFDSKSANQWRTWVSAQFAAKEGLELEYFEISNIKNLSPLSRKRKHQKYRGFLAVFSGKVRLIDNIALNY